MGTIAEKLSYLTDTKQLFKERLNSLGAEIIENTTFRNYLNWLDEFYNQSSDKTDLSENGVVGRTSQDGDPTPENPVEINNLSGDVEYKVRGKNLFDKGNYIELNGTPNTSGTFTGGGANYNIVIPCQPNTTYTIQKRNDGNTNRFAFFCSETIPSDADSVQTRILNGTRNDPASEITITTASTAKYLIAHYYRNVETALTKQQLLDSIQIEEGSQATSYESHISESFPLSLKSKNLFDKDSGFGLGYINTSGNFVNSSFTACFRNQYIPCQPNTTYTISFAKIVSNLGCPIYYDKNKNFLSRENTQYNTTSRTITTPSNCYYMIIQFNYNDIQMTQEIIDSVNCQVEEGSTPTDYEPYYDIELCNISDYKDQIYSQNGEFYLEKKTGKVVFDGSGNWEQAISNIWGDKTYTYNGLTNFIPWSHSLSNYFISADISRPRVLNNGEMQTAGFSLVLKNDDTATLADFKTWLSTHNTEVQYVLATPTTTEITEENYPTLYSQLLAIQEFLTKYKINKEFLLDYSSPEIEY